MNGMQESVNELLEKACDRICDELCKWPEYYKQNNLDEDRLYEEKCENCPLDLLIG